MLKFWLKEEGVIYGLLSKLLSKNLLFYPKKGELREIGEKSLFDYKLF